MPKLQPNMTPLRRTSGGWFRHLRIAAILLLVLAGAAAVGWTTRPAQPAHHSTATPFSATAFRSHAVQQAQAAAATAPANPPAVGPLVSASLNHRVATRRLPASFLGLSIESWNLQRLDSDRLALERVLKLLTVPRDGGLMLRVGGQSTEQTYWDSPDLGTDVPAFRPSAAWMNSLNSITRAAGLKLLLDLNLAAQSPDMAARFAGAAFSTLPARSIAAFEVGNEPDIGHRLTAYPAGTPRPSSPRGWDQYTSAAYDSAFRAYGKALEQTAPGVPLAGPEVFFPGKNVSWLQSLIAADPARVGMLTVHRYPLASCANPAWHDYATIARVLGQNASVGLAHQLSAAVGVGQQAHLPVRLSEVNSVTCGGSMGVSNTFATALWAADTLFSMWSNGVSGVNIHIQPQAPNAGFSVSRSGLVTHPLLYGMLTFARALGPGARLVATRVSNSLHSSLKVWAVQLGDGSLKVLVLDKGGHPVRLALNLPSRSAATVQRLSAPGVAATRSVTLGGQTLGAQGQWLGPRHSQRIAPTARGVYNVAVPRYSAALITIP